MAGPNLFFLFCGHAYIEFEILIVIAKLAHMVFVSLLYCSARGALRYVVCMHEQKNKKKKGGEIAFFQPGTCPSGNTFRGLKCYFQEKGMVMSKLFTQILQSQSYLGGQIWGEVPQSPCLKGVTKTCWGVKTIVHTFVHLTLWSVLQLSLQLHISIHQDTSFSRLCRQLEAHHLTFSTHTNHQI